MTFTARNSLVLWASLCCFLAPIARGAIEEVSEYTFDRFVSDFGRSYGKDSAEYRMREGLFDQRRQEIQVHNAREAAWKLGVDHFTDRTEQELARMRGYTRRLRTPVPPAPQQPSHIGSFLQVGNSTLDHSLSCSVEHASCIEQNIHSPCCSDLICGPRGTCVQAGVPPETVDYSTLPTADQVLEQGGCGGCWAVAATGAVQMQAVIVSQKRFRQTLSPQNILACTPNEYECGGQGQCQGATAELAFQWLRSLGDKGGVLTLARQKYTASGDGCVTTGARSQSLASLAQSRQFVQRLRGASLEAHDGSGDLDDSFEHDGSDGSNWGPAVGISGWAKLEDNNAQQMMRALVLIGPMVASVVGSGLQGYSSGIIQGCKSPVVDHAVLMMGYGRDQYHEQDYWKVRNSWGAHWGEGGYFRMLRRAPHGKEPCAWDYETAKGVACKDKPGPEGKYPEKQWVCGVCGILSDTAYPIGTLVPAALLDTSIEEETATAGVDATVLGPGMAV